MNIPDEFLENVKRCTEILIEAVEKEKNLSKQVSFETAVASVVNPTNGINFQVVVKIITSEKDYLNHNAVVISTEKQYEDVPYMVVRGREN